MNVEAVLADFRAWLQENAATTAPAVSAEAPDLFTLLGQFTGLRHEVNLQTKATRAQQEQNAEALRALSQALDALRESPVKSTGDDIVRPLLKAMLDNYDALALAQREVRRVQKKLLPALDEMAAAAESDIEPPPEPERARIPPPATSVLARWLGVEDALAQQRERLTVRETEQRLRHVAQLRELKRELNRAGRAAELVRRSLESVLTGYGMSLQRLDRALEQQGLEPILTVGQRFDPERMEVVEVVADSGQAAGAVIEEVRRGYLWRGQVFRFAQVRVAR